MIGAGKRQMLVYKIVARREREFSDEAQFEAFDQLLGAYRLDGHVLGRDLIAVSLKGHLESYVLVPANDAFQPQSMNEWIQKQRDKAKLVGLSEPDTVQIGNDPSEPGACECTNSGSLILFTTYLEIQSPVRCGDCFLPVPLYRLPRFESGEFVEVISWASAYKSCDSLFMGSSTGERFGYREMSRANSSLSLRGRAICKHFEEGTGKPSYYYLHRYYGRSRSVEASRECPGCRQQWLLKEKWHSLFDFRCETCRLVSCLSSSIV
jgi:predicted  nucleic acid-binding Zn ribbon protein